MDYEILLSAGAGGSILGYSLGKTSGALFGGILGIVFGILRSRQLKQDD